MNGERERLTKGLKHGDSQAARLGPRWWDDAQQFLPKRVSLSGLRFKPDKKVDGQRSTSPTNMPAPLATFMGSLL
jgi:hypothetical protein